MISIIIKMDQQGQLLVAQETNKNEHKNQSNKRLSKYQMYFLTHLYIILLKIAMDTWKILERSGY